MTKVLYRKAVNKTFGDAVEIQGSDGKKKYRFKILQIQPLWQHRNKNPLKSQFATRKEVETAKMSRMSSIVKPDNWHSQPKQK